MAVTSNPFAMPADITDVSSDLGDQDRGINPMLLFSAYVQHAGFLRWLATLAALYLLAMDRTNWRTNMPTTLLVPYVLLNLPSVLFRFLRAEVGRWLASIALVLKLFFPQHFPGSMELPAVFIFLLVAIPGLLGNFLRDTVVGVVISLIIGSILLHQHIHSAGGFRNAFAEKGGILNTLGILVLFISPLWELVKLFS